MLDPARVESFQFGAMSNAEQRYAVPGTFEVC
jgi:hypothetical protein